MPLRYGPYRPPRCRIGSRLYCHRREQDVEVVALSATGWPLTRKDDGGGRPEWIWCAPVVQLLTLEAAGDVAALLGIDRTTVSRWRAQLGVQRMNPGTAALWHDLAEQKLSTEARRKGGRKGGQTTRERRARAHVEGD